MNVLRVEDRKIGHPERVVPVAFLIGMAVGTILLMLPLARAGALSGSDGAPFLVALFTATSALCVTGLTVVDTPAYWSPFGHLVILLLAQAGGLGIMTGATLLGLLVTRRMKLSGRLLASAEMRSLDLGDVRNVLRLVVVTTFATELLLAVWLALRFWGLGHGLAEAMWLGTFHSVMAFVNAGFSILPEGFIPHYNDVLLLSPLAIGVIMGGVGFPVLYELRKEWRRPKSWSIHTKLTLWGSIGLTIFGLLATLLLEFDSPETLGPLGWGHKIFGAFFHSVMTRSGGFNSFDVGALQTDSLLISTSLMLIGGGSASTAGGIRITTFLLLGFVVWSEIRGNPDSVAFRRRISHESQRLAVAIVLLSVAFVSLAILALASFVEAPLQNIMFEVTSAFATVGLSVGLAPELPPLGQLILVLVMYVGRVGTISLATAIALRVRSTPYRYPEERPIVG